MKRKAVSVVFDRLNEVTKKGVGKVEIIIRLSRNIQKRITIKELTPKQWEKCKGIPVIEQEIAKYEKIVSAMEIFGEEMSVINLNKHLGIEGKAYKRKELTPEEEAKKKEKEKQKVSFLDFMRDEIVKERCKESTKKQKLVTLDALARWGGIVTFADLTSKKLREFDEWLREDGTRSDVAVYNYTSV